ncbi:SDR family NAD(P)-dependent oxidoreductase [Streptomyces millisiae]|uniref:SDR family NAD(P)-dependent oxidoreductase n=1 Tax=Streptomyces millisiae TaxID=3075542 RepID=A0ABU2LX77_9ACTN|nr:SDR family NAD(P)-dependent oxidoreductase [Streptomyces sp. DSM 44918]MDT0322154.1 SDR family NAD(P)-dependent oxidoreductase [Streptomyces sp. DSM 44918]
MTENAQGAESRTLKGKQAIVTGATRGIGEAIVRRLTAQGMSVVMIGRSDTTLRQAADRIRAAVPGAELRLESADLSLIRDVRSLADRLADSTSPSVVINNAAVTADTGTRTDEGVQLTLATNHLAPYVLMRTLAESVKAPARFVVVGASPTVLRSYPVDLDDLHAQEARALSRFASFRPFAAYARTKNMNTMFVYSLARRLADSGITINGAHPGIIAQTGLSRDARGLEKALARMVNLNPFRKSPDQGADNPVWVATDPSLDGVNGRFFVDRKDVTTPDHTLSFERCEALWERSAELVGMEP